MVSDAVKLVISMIIDVAGMVAYFIPFIGWILNLGIALLGAAWIKLAYGTTKGAVFDFVEQVIPIMAFFPTCTIIHLFRETVWVKRLLVSSPRRK